MRICCNQQNLFTQYVSWFEYNKKNNYRPERDTCNAKQCNYMLETFYNVTKLIIIIEYVQCTLIRNLKEHTNELIMFIVFTVVHIIC